jgi:antitoxin component of MazEF toxin-antitoxin module
MAKISMVIPDEALAEIDASAGGNRTAFMLVASLERAREVRRQREDAEIAELCRANAKLDAIADRDWGATVGDGLA